AVEWCANGVLRRHRGVCIDAAWRIPGKGALDPGSTSETMRRTAPQNVRKSPCAVRRPGVRRWHQEVNWCPSRPATAVLLCGLGFPQLPDHQAVRSPMSHKWEGNIRPKMLSTTFLSFALFDSDHHAFTINISGFKTDCLRDAQPSGVAGRQDGAMFETLYAGQKLQDFFRTWSGPRTRRSRNDHGGGPIPS